MTTAQKDRITSSRVLMLFELSGGGCFRAVAGLEASLKLASSGLAEILSAMMRVYYPDNGTMGRRNGSRPCPCKKKLPQHSSNLIFPCGSAKHLAEHSHSCHSTCRISNASPKTNIAFCISRGLVHQAQGCIASKRSREMIGMPARSHPTPTQACTIELPLWEIP